MIPEGSTLGAMRRVLAMDDVMQVGRPGLMEKVTRWFRRRKYAYDGKPQMTKWEEVSMPKEEKAMMTICDEAKGLVYGEREQAYDHPAVDFARTAAMWTALLGMYVSPQMVGLCMIAVKLSREVHKHNRDNLVDIAGYAETVQRVVDHFEGEGGE